MTGYAGKILYVDLTTGSISQKPLDLEQARSFIGGLGLNQKLAYDIAKPGTDALSPDNPIILGAGVLVGTMVPGAVKIFATAKLPLTGTFCTPAASMSFGGMLKWAGYDHVVITGRADKPVYLKIFDDNVELCDAGHLWGKDVLEATEQLKSEHEDCGVICIGPAGENMVKCSLALVDGVSTLGRGGLGAVMGAKNLKAIIAYGTKGIKVASKPSFMKAVKDLHKRIINFRGRDAVVDMGMMGAWEMLLKEYFCTEHLTPERVTELYSPEVYKKVRIKNIGCPSCMVRDKEVLKMTEGEFAGLEMPTTSFINLVVFATRFAIEDISQAGYLLNSLNRYGLCGQTLEGLLDFAISLYEHGIITKDDTDGMELRRDFATVKTLIEKIAQRQGFGNILADGWAAMINKIGRDCEKYAYVIKGINFIWEPRLYTLGSMEFEQLVSPRGPYSAYGGSPTTVPGLPPEVMKRHCDRVGVSPEQIDRIFDSTDGFNLGRLTRYFEDWVSLLSCMGICNRAQNDRYYSATICADLYSAAVGFELSREEVVKAAERAWNVSRALNVREGFTSKEDIIPEQWFQPLRTADGKQHVMRDYFNSKTLTRQDVVRWLKDYYIERGWDAEKGIPTKEKLVELGLERIDKDLERYR